MSYFHRSLGFPDGSDGKESAYNAGDLGSIPGLGRSPGEENGNPLQYSCLENAMDRGAWQARLTPQVLPLFFSPSAFLPTLTPLSFPSSPLKLSRKHPKAPDDDSKIINIKEVQDDLILQIQGILTLIEGR